MIPANFEYFAPTTIDEALELLAQHGDDCKVLSGGHSLVPVLKLRLATPGVVVDIGRIKELNFIKVDGHTIRIGALATHHAIASSSDIKQHCPLLAETAAQIGDQQVRNRGTIGGSLTHADPAADYPAAVLALGAVVVVRGQQGERVIKASDFFVDMLTSAVQPGEIVTEIRIPAPAQPKAAAYLKVPQSASGFAIVGVAAQITMDGGKCKDVSIGVTGLAPKAFRAKSVEDELRGKPLDEATINAAVDRFSIGRRGAYTGEKELILDEATWNAEQDRLDAIAHPAMEDIHASGEYRRHLTRVYMRRALAAAASRA